MQMPAAAAGDWFDALKAEHAATLALFDKIEATNDSQTGQRTALLAKLKYALTKHAHEEESIIYPALRQANSAHDADALNSEHGYVKTYLYELENLAKNSPDWLARVRDFRTMLEEHIRMEEDEVYPAFKQVMSEEQNAKLTSRMNKEGFRMA
jgi:hemerythrin superfamily protein